MDSRIHAFSNCSLRGYTGSMPSAASLFTLRPALSSTMTSEQLTSGSSQRARARWVCLKTAMAQQCPCNTTRRDGDETAHVLAALALGVDLRKQPDALAALGLRLGRAVVHADDVQEEVRRVVLRQALQAQGAEVRRLQRALSQGPESTVQPCSLRSIADRISSTQHCQNRVITTGGS